MRGRLPRLTIAFAAMVLLISAFSQVALASNITIDFNGISGGNGSQFNTYMESGFTVSALTDNWLVAQDGGNPGPYIYMLAQPGDMLTGTISVTDGGSQFRFNSIDLYSSITTIPYTFTGLLNNNVVFSVSGTVPNTFGNFATVMNPDSSLNIDTLQVTLTDSPGPCCSNPMGLDNIVLSTSTVTTPEPATLALMVTGMASLGALRRKMSRRSN